MTKDSRVSRPPLERTSPKRDFAHLLDVPGANAAEAQAETEPAGSSRHGPDTGDVLDHGVRLAYSVIRDQIRQGQQAAQRLVAADTPGKARNADDLLQRMMRLSTDFGSFMTDFLESTLNGGADQRRKPGRANGAAAEARGGRAPTVAIEVQTMQPSRVVLDLASGEPNENLAVPALLSLNGDQMPLTDVRFDRGLLRVCVPEVRAPGTYTGVVLDRESEELRGTLSITLLPADGDSTHFGG